MLTLLSPRSTPPTSTRAAPLPLPPAAAGAAAQPRTPTLTLPAWTGGARPHTARPAPEPADEPGWHDLWWRAGTGHEGPWGLQVRALQADHAGLGTGLAGLPVQRLVAVNAAGRLQATADARPQFVPRTGAAWAFAVEQRTASGDGQRSVRLFDRWRQPLLALQLDPGCDATSFYALARHCGNLALRPRAHTPGDSRPAWPQPPTPGAHRLPVTALPDLLTRAAQAGLALQLHVHLSGADVHLPLQPLGLQAGRGFLRLDAQGCSWQLDESALGTLWWLPAAAPGGSPWLKLCGSAGQPLASLGAAPTPAGRRPCGWQTLMAEALNED